MLQEKLETTGSCSDLSQQPSEDGLGRSRDDSLDSDLRIPVQEDGLVTEEGQEEGEGGEGRREETGEVLSQAIGRQNMVVTAPEAGLRLEVVQENGDAEQEEIKYFPPRM